MSNEVLSFLPPPPTGQHELWPIVQSWPIVDGADAFYTQLVAGRPGEGGVVEGGSAEGGRAEGGAEEGGAEEGGAEEGGSEEGGSEEGGSEEGGNQEGGNEEGGTEEGGPNNGGSKQLKTVPHNPKTFDMLTELPLSSPHNCLSWR